jgi:hypothetical protein
MVLLSGQIMKLLPLVVDQEKPLFVHIFSMSLKSLAKTVQVRIPKYCFDTNIDGFLLLWKYDCG